MEEGRIRLCVAFLVRLLVEAELLDLKEVAVNESESFPSASFVTLVTCLVFVGRSGSSQTGSSMASRSSVYAVIPLTDAVARYLTRRRIVRSNLPSPC